MDATDTKWALEEIGSAVRRSTVLRSYYDGDHPQIRMAEKWREAFGDTFDLIVDNCAPVIVETVENRLAIAGFTVVGGENDDPTAERRREIWRRNRMQKRVGEIHLDALVDGDAYAIVWPDAENRAVIYPNQADRVAVRYDEEQPGYITLAAKCWRRPDKHLRLTLYYRDRIEKYVTRMPVGDTLPKDAAAFEPFQPEGESWPVPNPYDKVPVFHFGNRARTSQRGRSELTEALSLIRANNKTLLDTMVAMEFYAIRQRWATGLADSDDGKLKSGGIWAVSTPDTKFGEFAASDITQFLAVGESLRKEIARVTRTPLHYFTLEGNFPSGEAQKVADSPLISKVEKKQVAWGMVWADLMRFALEIEGIGGLDLETEWRDMQPRNEREQTEIGKAKRELGVSETQVLVEQGYAPEEIERFRTERATRDVLPEEVM